MNLGGAAEGGRGEVGGREAPAYVAGGEGSPNTKIPKKHMVTNLGKSQKSKLLSKLIN